ncbi:MAG TPA: proton-conducting transporter membrane subunit [Propionibacteriaceae bacterium]|nr:proton-conducting transporter membrane subunit [Propionibacteriaceae bacterium]
MAVLLWLPVLGPAVLAALLGWRHRHPYTHVVPVAAALLVLGCGVALVARREVISSWVLRADATASYMVLCVGAVAVVALWGGLSARAMGGRSDALVCAFLAAMSLAVLSDNLGVMWVAVEATTIATAFLVGHAGDRGATEAAWKYVVLGSVGVAIAFLGIVLLYASTGATPTLSWAALTGGHVVLSPHLARAGIALAVLGFATKAGLAPMHSWLPDAHSQAPAPVSGLMSGVLLSVAMYAILRVESVSAAHIGVGLVRGLLVAAGLLSLVVASLLTLTQRDYKRLLAYSSIEHMGVIALGVGSGTTLGLVAALLHILAHGIVKAAMFVVAGRVRNVTGTARIARVTGLLSTRPDLGRQLLVGSTALLGFPPHLTFFTEVAVLVALVQARLWWAAAAAGVLLLVAFVGISRQVLRMTLGTASPHRFPPEHALVDDPPSRLRSTPVALALVASAVLGFLALPLAPVLEAAAAALGVRP